MRSGITEAKNRVYRVAMTATLHGKHELATEAIEEFDCAEEADALDERTLSVAFRIVATEPASARDRASALVTAHLEAGGYLDPRVVYVDTTEIT